MVEPGDVVFTINQALPDEEEALRRVQAIAIRRFLERVLDNRKRPGMSVPRGNLSANDHLYQESEPMSELRCAFYGRVSTDDNQDPTLSLPRQLRNCQEAVERIGGEVVAHYYDIESGAMRFVDRGSAKSLKGFTIPIPREGGLPELLEQARDGGFDVVVCENINRFSRNPAVTFPAEEQLRESRVKLWPIDEPWEESFGSIVLRHVNVGVARGYIHELKVKSRQGIETATRQAATQGANRSMDTASARSLPIHARPSRDRR